MENVKCLADSIYVKVFFATAAVIWSLGLKTSNMFTFVFIILIYCFLKNEMVQQDKMEHMIVVILSAIFAVLWVAGNYTTYHCKGILLGLQYIFSIIGMYILLNRVISWVFHLLISVELYEGKDLKIKPLVFACIVFIVCIVCWMPYFLAYYPGIITDDAEWQLAQAIGIRSYSNHQPWVHTMMHKLFYNIGIALFHTPNAGVAACVIAQMCVMAGTFSYVVTTFYKEKFHQYFILVCIVYYAIVPFNALYAVTLWKDVVMGAVIVLFSMSIWKMGRNEKNSIGNYILFVVTGVLFCIMRSNGFYAYFLCVPFFFIFHKKIRKIVIPMCFLTIVVAMLYRGPILSHFQVPAPDTIESLSIPAQHIARVITDGGVLEEGQEKLLEKVVDVEKIPDVYDSAISDPIKTLVREKGNQTYIEQHKWEFLELWIELGIEHPSTYLKAQIDQTLGYWYPDVQYWVTTTMLKENSWGMFRNPHLPEWGIKFLKYLENAYVNIPVLGLFWSIGMYTWLLLLLSGVAIYRRKKITPFLPVLTILLTLMIATPVQAEFRYSYGMMATMPLFLIIGCTNYQKEEINETDRCFGAML